MSSRSTDGRSARTRSPSTATRAESARPASGAGCRAEYAALMEGTTLAVVWRRRWLIAIIVVAIVGGTAVLAKTLPKVYVTSSTLLISLAGDEQTFDSVQAGQALARSYAEIIQSPVIARLVAERLGRPDDVTEIGEAVSFQPLTETQLLRITAEA